MDKEQIAEQARDLVQLAEDGDKFALSLQLNRMDPLDRLEVAREIDRLNEQRRKTVDADLPDIVISTSPSDFPGGPLQLSDIQLVEERAKYNPLRWFGDDFTTKDIYDPQSDN